MPNWCEGSLRIRGKKENIRNFLKNELICSDYNDPKPPEIEEDNSYIVLRHPTRDDFYINNTYRNFIFTNQIEVYFDDYEDDEDCIINIDCFNSAWALRSDGWADHAKKYNLDFKMFGFEQGMQFSQVMTILSDGSVNEETQHYNDWYWDCPFPNMGG